MKIDFLVANNTYGTAAHFTKGLAAACERYGMDIRIFFVDDGNFFQAFYAILDDPPDLTCSFSDISISGKSLSDFWTIPHLSFLIDPPVYFLHQICGKKSLISCVDHNDCAFVKNLGFQNLFFLPHGVDPQFLTPVCKKRPFEFVFFGSCIDYEKILLEWPRKENDLLLAASERVLSPSGISIAEALSELQVNSEDFPRYHAEVDRYTRGKDRIALLNSLRGEKVHVWGEGPWERYLNQDYHIHPPVSFLETVEIMKESRIVLNSSPRFKNGSHERIFYGYLCGAAVYTGLTPYLKKEFPKLFTYNFGEWGAVNFNPWIESAEEGQRHVIENHIWDRRVEQISFFFKQFMQKSHLKKESIEEKSILAYPKV